MTISTSVNGHREKKTLEYVGPDVFFLAQLAERWRHANATVESILSRASRELQLQIHFEWSMKDAHGMVISGRMPLDSHELLALAKDSSAKAPILCSPGLDPSFYQYSLTCPNKTPMATRSDLVVTSATVVMMEEEYPELKPPPPACTGPVITKAVAGMSRTYRLEELAAECRKTEDDLLHQAESSELRLAFHYEKMAACLRPGGEGEYKLLPQGVAFIRPFDAGRFLSQEPVDIFEVLDIDGGKFATLGKSDAHFAFKAMVQQDRTFSEDKVLKDGTFIGRLAPSKVTLVSREMNDQLHPVTVSRQQLFVLADEAVRLITAMNIDATARWSLQQFADQCGMTVNDVMFAAANGKIRIWGRGQFKIKQTAREYFGQQTARIEPRYFVIRKEEILNP